MADNHFYCSRISYLEVLGYQKISLNDKLYFQKFFNLISIIELSKEIVDEAVALKQRMKMSIGDSLIAASAELYQLTLITNNENDFKKIKNISIINPFKL